MAYLILQKKTGSGAALPAGFAGTPVQQPADVYPVSLGASLDQLDSNHYILTMRTATGPNNGVKAIVVNVSGTTVTWGSWFNIETTTQCGGHICRVAVNALDSSRAIVSWSVDSAVKLRTLSISGTTISSGGSIVTVDSGATIKNPSIVTFDTDKTLMTWVNTDSGHPYNRCAVATSTGTTISMGTEMSWTSGNFVQFNTASDIRKSGIALDSSRVLLAGGSNGTDKATVMSISGTTITDGTDYLIAISPQRWKHTTVKLDATRSVFIWTDGANSNRLSAVVMTTTGATVAVGTPTVISANAVNSAGNLDADLSTTNKVVVTYIDDVTGKQTIQTLSISGSSVSAGTETELSAISMAQGRLYPIDATQGFFTYNSGGNFYGVVTNY